MPRRGCTATRFSSASRLTASRSGVRPISSSRISSSSRSIVPGRQPQGDDPVAQLVVRALREEAPGGLAGGLELVGRPSRGAANPMCGAGGRQTCRAEAGTDISIAWPRGRPVLDGWLGVEAVRDARERTRDLVRHTPVLTSRSLSDECGGTVLLKAENLQRTGSFKLRGALAKVDRIAAARAGDGDSAPARSSPGSAGNHAQSLAYAARARGLACEVFMPAEASLAKVAAVRGFGGTVRLGGDSVDGCVARARERAAETGAVFVHPFDDPEIVAGQGTLGLELLDDVEDLAAVVRAGRRRRADRRRRRRAQGGAARRAGDRRAGRELLGVPRVARARRAGRGRAAARRSPTASRSSAPAGSCCRSCARGSTSSSSSRRTTSPRRWSCCSSAPSWSSRAPARSASPRCSPARSCPPSAARPWSCSRAATSTRACSQPSRCGTRPPRAGGCASSRASRTGRAGSRACSRCIAEAGGNLVTVTHVREAVPLHLRQTGVDLLLETRGADHAAEIVAALEQAGYGIERAAEREH